MSDLRPIFLCNVLFKIISKVLANRLKVAFPDRKRVGKEGFMALKLDMSKAYDRVGWEFFRSKVTLNGFQPSYCLSNHVLCDNCYLQCDLWGESYGAYSPRGAPRVSHMLFADDSYVYCKANDK
ncbi:hypothetical protein CsatB_000715 [Cannabis sativa]